MLFILAKSWSRCAYKKTSI